MNLFRLTVSTPNGNAFDGEAVSVSLRGAEGELAVMAGHIPFITSVKPCRIKIETDDDEIYANIGGGILSVSKKETVLMSSSFEKE